MACVTRPVTLRGLTCGCAFGTVPIGQRRGEWPLNAPTWGCHGPAFPRPSAICPIPGAPWVALPLNVDKPRQARPRQVVVLQAHNLRFLVVPHAQMGAGVHVGETDTKSILNPGFDARRVYGVEEEDAPPLDWGGVRTTPLLPRPTFWAGTPKRSISFLALCNIFLTIFDHFYCIKGAQNGLFDRFFFRLGILCRIKKLVTWTAPLFRCGLPHT